QRVENTPFTLRQIDVKGSSLIANKRANRDRNTLTLNRWPSRRVDRYRDESSQRRSNSLASCLKSAVERRTEQSSHGGLLLVKRSSLSGVFQSVDASVLRASLYVA